MKNLIDALKALDAARVLENEPMSRHTTFRIGGPADIIFYPASAEEIILAQRKAAECGVPCFVAGNGSNLLVSDKGIRGLVIILGEHFSGVAVDGTCITAQAGASMARVAAAAQEASLTGLEFASGIPGTLGGGCAMNAGAYGGQLSDVLVSADVLINDRVVTLTRDEMEMGYRTTLPLRQGGIVLKAVFELTAGDRQAIIDKMKDLNARRRDKQPLNLPSAGSVFKRPEGNYAGALIEQCGLKGCTVGGAQVSEKHAGFIVNIGGATANDVCTLISRVQKEVKEKTGYWLETEVRIIGEK